MSDIACHCGRKGALFAREDNKLTRYHLCREHLDPERVKIEGLKESLIPPSMPEIFFDTDISRLHPKIQSVMDWKPDGNVSGLLLHGTTGVGKTRGIWEIIKRMWVNETKKDKQLNYIFLTMRKLEGKIEKSFDERNHSDMIDSLISCNFLVLDDFGKERLTSRMASDLFSIIDERSISRKSTLITTNFNSSTILDRFENKDKETGVAIIRRFKDYYKIVGMGT
jgi:DNA replication protein DnaC